MECARKRRQASVSSITACEDAVDNDQRFLGVSRSDCLHLVVLQHGMWGNNEHVRFLGKQLVETHGPSEGGVRVMLSAANEFRPKVNTNTYDGISAGGEKLLHEILDEIAVCPNVVKLSMIGYSLGGIFSRYAAGKLEERGVFDRIQPVNFVTCATPHMGVRRPSSGIVNTVAVWITRKLSTTGLELLLEHLDRSGAAARQQHSTIPSDAPLDGHGDGESAPPVSVTSAGRKISATSEMLYEMTIPNSCFYRALSKFAHLTNYANLKNDVTVPFCTAAILPTNPYEGKKSGCVGGGPISTAVLPLNDSRYPHVMYVEPPGHKHDFGESYVPYAGDDKAEILQQMYQNLSSLPWKRVHAQLPFGSHGHMVVRRPGFHSKGTDVVQHLADNFEV